MSELTKSRQEAFTLLSEYTKSESLIKHALAVEAAMRWYAEKYGEDPEYWGMTGLLHDFDYEQYPNVGPEGHPQMGSQILAELGYPELMRTAILGHAQFTGVQRESLLAKALFACDELAGLITAATLVRPDKAIRELSVSSVKKRLKDKAFARGVNRDEVRQGAEELGVELDQHIANVIEAMQRAATELGLEGVS